MNKEIKRELTLKLISMFRERECLWNTDSIKYRRSDLKTQALMEIANEVDMNVEDVKKKIRSLRSTYIGEKKKVDQSIMEGCDAEDMYEPLLHWYGEMSFLDDYIASRKPKSNCTRDSINEETNFLEDSEQKSYDSENSLPPTPKPRKRKRKHQDITEQYDEQNEEIVNFIDMPRIDAFGAFAESMAITLRTMPEDVAYKTMAEIQDLLYRRKFGKYEVIEGANGKSYNGTTSSDTYGTETVLEIVKDEIEDF
ncbi:uncharacterized protein [Musca autumnalis]|uniref:uncharacterized protein n=1 Tax=Musca autumnalis TaxID=221902 RepID=UPI003CE87008